MEFDVDIYLNVLKTCRGQKAKASFRGEEPFWLRAVLSFSSFLFICLNKTEALPHKNSQDFSSVPRLIYSHELFSYLIMQRNKGRMR